MANITRVMANVYRFYGSCVYVYKAATWQFETPNNGRQLSVDQLIRIAYAIEFWLKLDENNVCVLHASKGLRVVMSVVRLL